MKYYWSTARAHFVSFHCSYLIYHHSSFSSASLPQALLPTVGESQQNDEVSSICNSLKFH
jgi:hypothetical protein